MRTIRTHNLGYPRLGEQRELKKATEAYWRGELSATDLLATGARLRAINWEKQRAAGIDLVPVGDFSFYDQVLDLTCLLGNLPARFGPVGDTVGLDTMFLLARGQRPGTSQHTCDCHGAPQESLACEMTKWFDTNYHYLVPEFHAGTTFRVATTKVFDEFQETRARGLDAKPVLLGPISYLALGKAHDGADFDPFSLLDSLVDVYAEILQRLASLGARWIQLDEPVLALDLSPTQREALHRAYARLSSAAGSTRLLVATYFGPLKENRADFLRLPVAALHYDAVRGSAELPTLLAEFPADKILSLGVVDGRNIWKNDYARSLELIQQAAAAVGPDRLWLAPSCSLLHSPITLAHEGTLDPEIRDWLAFADEKLAELAALRDLAEAPSPHVLEENQRAIRARQASPRVHQPAVQARLHDVQPADFQRARPFTERQLRQRETLRLPAFPTTTIGSFPQTEQVRAARAKWRKGELPAVAYDALLRHLIADCVEFQESIGLDVLVHGEFERNDMVEYFGEQLAGFVFSQHGWVQSYGSRYVKPPIIFGDVFRPRPMTVRWSQYAQSLTKLPMKGMLTGPVTILQWSFVRDDQPRETTALQIALAIRDEVADLERAGLPVIQIDEPALREGLPLRRADWAAYLDWAGRAFRLSASAVRDETQIHTHMCYSEFNDIIPAIAALDADVITIETARSQMELLESFVEFQYPNEIGPGVYDIHSPRVPTVEEMEQLMLKTAEVLPAGNLWVNPDCGLKTRGWEEVRAALRHLVEAARRLRATITAPAQPAH